jgi:hypothetical protein
MGLKYYLYSTNKAPTHNLSLLNTYQCYLGQADFMIGTWNTGHKKETLIDYYD